MALLTRRREMLLGEKDELKRKREGIYAPPYTRFIEWYIEYIFVLFSNVIYF
jgi:hypothetical protein